MTTEEKAKRFDEIVEEFRVLLEGVHENSNIMKEDILKIVPELKKSEDECVERIKKEIISYLNNRQITSIAESSAIEKWLTWIEKQGKNNMGISEATKQELDDNLNNALEKETPESCNEFLEKQGEQKHIIDGILTATNYDKIFQNCNVQKSADKSEPKFHEGEWIISKYMHLVMQIINNDNGFYKTVETDGTERNDSYYFIERNFKLWTLEDAKDGDVLHSIGWHNDCIFIFNGLDNWRFDEPNGDRAVATGYCCLFVSADKIEFGMQGPDCIEVDSVKPATKIQRDLLFQKMKEAGYEWDAEKKELKKIESKPAWSEEDEEMRIDAIKYLELFDAQGIHGDVVIPCIEWLKSLKDKVQPKWKPSKEQMKQLKNAADIYPDSRLCYDLKTLYQDLKKYIL